MSTFNGYIRLHRQAMTSWLWTLPAQQFKVAVTLVMMANWRDGRAVSGGQMVDIPRGAFLTSLEAIATASKTSIQTVRTTLAHLERYEFITRRSTRHNTIISIVNYESYQSSADEPNTPATHGQQTTSTPATHGQQTTNTRDINTPVTLEYQIFSNGYNNLGGEPNTPATHGQQTTSTPATHENRGSSTQIEEEKKRRREEEQKREMLSAGADASWARDERYRESSVAGARTKRAGNSQEPSGASDGTADPPSRVTPGSHAPASTTSRQGKRKAKGFDEVAPAVKAMAVAIADAVNVERSRYDLVAVGPESAAALTAARWCVEQKYQPDEITRAIGWRVATKLAWKCQESTAEAQRMLTVATVMRQHAIAEALDMVRRGEVALEPPRNSRLSAKRAGVTSQDLFDLAERMERLAEEDACKTQT